MSKDRVKLRDRIITVLKKADGPVSVQGIKQQLGHDSRSVNTVLHRLKSEGLIGRVSRGVYCLSEDDNGGVANQGWFGSIINFFFSK